MNRRLPPLLLAALVLVVFLPALRNGFVWDDQQYVLENPHVTGGLTAGNLRWALTSFLAGNWHPLTWASHMLDVRLFGLAAWGHHLTNVLLHLANTLLLYLLLRGLTGAAGRSLLVAALFAVHPLHVESVAWVAERKDVLSTLLGLLALGAYLRYARRPSPGRYGAVVALFAAGLTAKPMLVTLPFLLLLLDAWPLGRLGRASWRGPLLEKLPLLALSAASSVVTFRAQVSAGAYSPYTLPARLTNAVVAYGRYLGKTFAPVGLSAYYPHAEETLPLGLTAGTLLGLCLATALVVLVRHRRPWLAVGWFWFAGTLVPVIGLVQVGQQAIADRYTYVPLIGVFIAAAWSLGEAAARRPAWRPALVAVPALAVAALSVASIVQLRTWRDSVALYTRAIEVTPGNWLAHFNLGVHYQEQGREEEAAAHYRAALETKPYYEKALNNLGTIAAEQGRSTEAVTWYRAALEAKPEFPDALGNLGAELVKQGRFGEAEALLRQALGKSPDFYEARMNLAELLLRQGRWPESVVEFAGAVRLRPDAARARKGYGVALARLGRYGEAIGQFQEALRLDPADADSRANLAVARARLGR
jgi:Flp pilus assembly protein TadD